MEFKERYVTIDQLANYICVARKILFCFTVSLKHVETVGVIMCTYND